MNAPKYSKINWTAGAALAASVAVAFGAVPAEHETLVLQVTSFLAPVAIMLFRTWYTDKT